MLATEPAELGGPERAAYLLTAKGGPSSRFSWRRCNGLSAGYRAPRGPAMTLTHLDCRAGFTGELACDQCDPQASRDELAPGIA